MSIIQENIISELRKYKFNLSNEKSLQMEINKILLDKYPSINREYYLDNKNIIDFYLDGIGIEIKIKGNPKQIYKQLERYSNFNSIKKIILVTSKSMGLPATINNKDIYYLNISQNWL